MTNIKLHRITRSLMLNNGPVTLSERVLKAMRQEGPGCREPEFAELTREINSLLVRVYREMPVKFESVMLTGSGACAVEAMLASFAPAATSTLVVTNGLHGEQMAAMLAAHGKPHCVVQSGSGEAIDLEQVRNEIDRRTDITHLAVVHNESSTGRLNDLREVSKLCAEQGIRLLLDCVGSFGAEAINADELTIAALAGTADKCLHGAPGISFVLATKELWKNELVPAGSVYLDLAAYYQGQHGEGYSPFTQAVPAVLALREALDELEDHGGWEQRRSIYRRRAGYIAVTLQRHGLKTLLPPAEYSCAVWSWRLPAGANYSAVHASLKANGFMISQGLNAESFRIAHMGDIRNDDLDRLEASLEKCFSTS
jgi:2-aminoethylphosphonate-pyruvate transaminase